MSGQIKFSSMPVATTVAVTDRVPLLVPTSGNQNQTVSLGTLFGNLSIPVVTSDNITIAQQPDVVNSATVFTADSRYALLENNTASAITVPLVDGEVGQELILVSKTLVSDVTVVPVNKLGFNQIRFANVGSTAKLQFIDGKWVIVSVYNVTVS